MHTPPKNDPPRRTASVLAQPQGGLLTARQAGSLGWRKQHLRYHVVAGNLVRIAHGLYRLPEIAPSRFDDLLRITLPAVDRSGSPIATVSHASALAVHGIGDSLPTRIHVTVPPGTRRTFAEGVVVHRARLAPSEIASVEGIRVTSPIRTLVDLARDESFPEDQLRSAVVDATTRGLLRTSDLRAQLAALAIPESRRRAMRL